MKKIRFSVIGLNHGHIYSQVHLLLNSGAELVSYYAPEPELREQFAAEFPAARLAGGQDEILEDESIDVIASAGIPADRAPLGIEVMRHGKDYLVDKPGATSLEQLEQVKQVQAETGRIYSIFYSERLASPSTVRAIELVREGAIGQVIQTMSVGPHRASLPARPPWFFERARYGGIICDIASHQFDQFLAFTDSKKARVVASQVANFAHPEHPELEDFGDILLQGEGCTGYIRVDWFTPDGLDSWGDGRVTVLGTEGYIEIRKYVDLEGRPGGDHLFLVDKTKTHYFDCSQVHCPYGDQLVHDIIHRTETAMTQEHCFLATELALTAQAAAQRLGHLAP